MKNVLVLMMGIPGSGKSTIALNKMTNKDIYISRDQIRYSLIEDNEEYFSKEKEVMKIFIDNINSAIQENKYRFIYADATHLNERSRRKVLDNITNKPNKIFLLFINTPLEIALERNNKRIGRERVPEKVIKNMFNSIEMPTEKEGISTVYILNQFGQLDFLATQKYLHEKGDFYDLL